jgi:hypothetical protein
MNCRSRVRILGVMLVLLLAACSSPDPMLAALRDTRPAPGAARLVIYYPAKIVGSDGRVEVKFGEDQACLLDGGSYLVRDVMPGKQQIGFSFCGIRGISYLQINVATGMKYYIRVQPYDSSITGVLSGYPTEYVPENEPEKIHKGPFQIERIDEPDALSELKSMKYISRNGAGQQ